MTELADTSVLILARRDPSIGRLMEGPIRLGEIATCDVVELEYLMGARNATDYDAIVEAFGGFKRLATEPADWARAREVHRAFAAQGPGYQRSVRIPDLLIAAVAERHRSRRASLRRGLRPDRERHGPADPLGRASRIRRPESERMTGSAMRPRFDSGSERFLEALRVAATLHAGRARKKTDMPGRRPPARHVLDRDGVRRERGPGDRGAPPRRHRGRRAGREGARRGRRLRSRGAPHRRGLHRRRHAPQAAVARAQGGVPRAPARVPTPRSCSSPRPTSSTTPGRSSPTCTGRAPTPGSGPAPRARTRSGTTAASSRHSGATPRATRISSTSSTGSSPRWSASRDRNGSRGNPFRASPSGVSATRPLRRLAPAGTAATSGGPAEGSAHSGRRSTRP